MDSTALQSIGDIALNQNAANSIAARKTGGNIDKASGDFNSMFMTQMLQPMFEGIGSDPLFGGGHGEEVMKSFLVQEYGKILSGPGKIGMSAAVKNEMIALQAKSSQPSTAIPSDGGQNVTVQ